MPVATRTEDQGLPVTCQCGYISFRTPTAQPLRIACCHCASCRKQSASAFGSSAFYPADAFISNLPQEAKDRFQLFTLAADSGNKKHCYFCPKCGVRLYGHSHKPDGTPLGMRNDHPARYLKVKADIIKHSLDDPTASPIVAVLEPSDEGWNGVPEITAFCIWYRESPDGEDDAEKDGLPVHLSATPDGATLYNSLGFRSVGKWKWRPGQDRDWEIMRWDPPKDAH
ncbi:hypothetical protein INS49_008232 [Diaporthe citri]|uniref:uncharacterized protein n=1 Tax=Diaporthe citri TaxID=83186 RepID=UPI001C7E5F1A|nr:uncharacterized protein INS49_008232 [Diaporthe citri]KAG6363137.1 hypothetical protein INS49_008232 [Diaporthe citri]